MKLRLFAMAALLLLWHSYGHAQKIIRDESVIYQQERMVFKQWDQNKFTPTHGFLWLNPLYWLTWAWHSDYHKNDLRPLGPAGPQTQRLALVAAMQNTDNAYKLQSDTLSNTAITEAINYTGLLSDTDPLWLLYYSKMFGPLLNQQDDQVLNNVSQKVRQYLVSSGIFNWYLDESHSLAERLNAARSTTLDRGSRIMSYYRLLEEYRKLNAAWDTKKQQAGLFLSVSEKANALKNHNGNSTTVNPPQGYRSDQQIADEILSHSKL